MEDHVDTLVGRGVLSLWVYHRYGGGTEVLFDDDGDLIAWRTDLTGAQLREIPKRRR